VPVRDYHLAPATRIAFRANARGGRGSAYRYGVPIENFDRNDIAGSQISLTGLGDGMPGGGEKCSAPRRNDLAGSDEYVTALRIVAAHKDVVACTDRSGKCDRIAHEVSKGATASAPAGRGEPVATATACPTVSEIGGSPAYVALVTRRTRGAPLLAEYVSAARKA